MQYAGLLMLGALLVSGCAEGSQIGGETFGGGGGLGGYGGGGYGGLNSTTGPGTTGPATTGVGAMGGFGGEGGMGGFGGEPSCDFTETNTCAAPMNMGAVSGDEGGTQVQAGVGSMWLQVLVEETSSSIFESDLSYRVTLNSPAGADYNLVIHQGNQNGPPNCNAPPKNGVAQGNNKVVTDDWDDDQGIGGEDDSVFLSIHVVHASGDLCGPSDNWTVTVVGDP